MEIALPSRLRFGAFEFDLKAGELRRGTRKILLQEQPFQILRMLVERRADLVTLEEIKRKLWPNDTVVEFDHSIHTAIKKLRQALGDSAENPKYIETVARRGYRLMVPVEWEEVTPTPEPAERKDSSSPDSAPAPLQIGVGVLTGKKVSHYRVLEILGGGGMGVVYKAEDLKLGRRVALKFLPEELGNDPVAIGRFEREARAASSLEHPNICPIYEFGEHEGQPFIVMQLLEGQTLRETISVAALYERGEDGGTQSGAHTAPLQINRVLDLALQIANGLDAAHQKRIIHRDIKPANIFVTTREEAKILDFGLAKLQGPGTGGLGFPEAATDTAPTTGQRSPTTDLSLTRTGVKMGTASYMSPEQVRGEKLDPRTDLFSFGLVLYEMATGQQAFAGPTAAVVHDSILHRTPIPARELNRELPPRLGEIITKALEKDRELRYQSASEMRIDLRTVGPEPAQAKPSGRSSLRRWAVAAGVSTSLLVAGLFWFTNRQPTSVPDLQELKQRQLTTNSSENPVSSGSISPDGRYLAYADLNGIHIKLIETGETENVPQPEDFKGMQVNWNIVSAWVRDGTRFIANANPNGKMQGSRSTVWMVPVMGGPPRKLRDDAWAGSVSRDGSWVAFAARAGPVGYRELWRMSPDGGQAQKLCEANEDSGFTGSEWSPDGQRLSYEWGHRVGDGFKWSIESCDLKGGPAVTAIPVAPWDWSWSPDGRMIYSKNEPGPATESCNFWAVRIDTRTGKPIEKPKRLTNWAGFCMDGPSPTADAKRLAFRKYSYQGAVYVGDLEANGTRMTAPRRLTLNEGRNFLAAWTADSKAVVFGSYRDGQWRAFKQSLDEDTAQPIATGTNKDVEDTRISPDGGWILYVALPRENDSSQLRELLRVPITGRAATVGVDRDGGHLRRCALHQGNGSPLRDR